MEWGGPASVIVNSNNGCLLNCWNKKLTRESCEWWKVVMFVPVPNSTQQILLLFCTGERRLPVKVVSAVRLASENWRSPPTIGCRQHQEFLFSSSHWMKYPTENQNFTATFHKNCCITKFCTMLETQRQHVRVTVALASVIVFPTTGWCYTQNKTIELWNTDSHMQSCCTQSWWWSFSQSPRSTWSRLGKSKSDLHLNTWRKGREGGRKWLGAAEIKHHPLANNPLIYYSCSQNHNRCGGKSAVKILDKRRVN